MPLQMRWRAVAIQSKGRKAFNRVESYFISSLITCIALLYQLTGLQQAKFLADNQPYQKYVGSS